MAVAAAIAMGCVVATFGGGCAGRIPLPASAQGLDSRAVIARLRAVHCTCAGYSAEVRLRYFGRGDRYKGTAQLFARRPDHLRYDVQGPHGGVLLAFATDGNQLAALDLGQNRLTQGAATPEHFDALLPLLPLGLTATQWVDLLFGEIAVPDDAALRYDDHAGLFWLEFPRGAYTVQLGVHPESFETRCVRGMVGDVQQWQAAIGPRDRHGLPTTLRLSAAAFDTDIALGWRDVDVKSGLPDAIFALPRPRGVQVRDLALTNAKS